MTKRVLFVLLLSSLCSLANANPLTLTAAGVLQGFTLTTFASNFPTTNPLNGIGPLGVAFPNSGGVLVADFADGVVRKFATDVDNQNYASSVLAAGATFGSNNEQTIFNLGGQLYMSQTNNGRVIKVNDDGSAAGGGYSATVFGAEGIGRNPNNGHLLVASCGGGGIFDVDPASGASALAIATGAGCDDGLTVNGNTVYVAIQGQGVFGYDITTTLLVFSVLNATIPNPDGIAAGAGTLAGNLFVNSNNGALYEINLGTNAVTQIADQGTRGDFVTVDPSNGSLLISESDRIMRLTPPPGATFNDTVPEPATLTLMGIGLGFAAVRRRLHRT